MSLATNVPVPILENDFQTMLHFARTIYQLEHDKVYAQALALHLPETVDVAPHHPSMLMGYDFHLTPQGPKLIEINNNAGGLYENDDGWIPQYEQQRLVPNFPAKLLAMFAKDWQHIAIMDEDITQQYMFPEMNAYAALLRADGRSVSLVSPEDLVLKAEGLYADGLKVDVIYNRHTDFYLESSPLAHIRQAFLEQQVVLNPYPRSYALLGDKNRMVDWWREGLLETFLNDQAIQLIRAVVPETYLLSEYDSEKAWQIRKSWVFKPAARHGGKGVMLGKGMSRKRFEQFDTGSTVMQKLVPASQIEIDGETFKFDIRLYMHGEDLIAMAGRAWNGQITNFRETGSGWVPIQVKSLAF